MKNKKKLFVFLVFMFLPFINVKADCDYNRQIELNQIASNVKAFYSLPEEPERFFIINILNITEDIYVKATIIVGDEKKEIGSFYYDESNKGQETFESYVIYQKATINLEIYSHGTTCGSSLLRKITIVTPRMNPNYSSAICQKNPTNSYCQKWSEYDVSLEQLKKIIENEKKDNNKQETEKPYNFLQQIINFIISYYIYLIIAFLLIIVTVFIIVKKRRKKRII